MGHCEVCDQIKDMYILIEQISNEIIRRHKLILHDSITSLHIIMTCIDGFNNFNLY